jgi:hypothetical protein
MAEIFNGRYTARTDKPLVLFLIGLRLNKLWAAHKWLPVFTAMPRMLAELDRKPKAGLLSHRTYWSGRIFLVAYAHDASAQHFPAWAAFNRAVGKDGTVGIWHETYLVEPGKYETIYANMPLFGLAAATTHVRAEGGLSAARDRMRGG